MALRNVIKEGDPTLREISKPVTEFDSRLSDFIDDLIDTMRHERGCGLAAPQVGILRRVCIVSPDEDTLIELVNPVIIASEGTQISYEGCLSVDNYRAKVTRPKSVTVSYQTRTGKTKQTIAEGYLATIFCHEIDHLDGILFVDREN